MKRFVFRFVSAYYHQADCWNPHISDLFYRGGYYDSGYFLFKNILKLYIYILRKLFL
jgi:hypothetical protein